MLSERDVWSPSKDKRQQAQQEIPSLFQSQLVQEFDKYVRDRTIKGELHGELHDIQDRMLELIATGKSSHVEALKADLEKLCEEGRAAVVAVEAAERAEFTSRQEQANRDNRYSRSVQKLDNAKRANLPQFPSDSEIARKKKSIESAQDELNTIVNDVTKNPISIPQSVYRVRECQSRVTHLRQQEKELRASLAQLTGETVPSEGNNLNGLQR